MSTRSMRWPELSISNVQSELDASKAISKAYAPELRLSVTSAGVAIIANYTFSVVGNFSTLAGFEIIFFTKVFRWFSKLGDIFLLQIPHYFYTVIILKRCACKKWGKIVLLCTFLWNTPIFISNLNCLAKRVFKATQLKISNWNGFSKLVSNWKGYFIGQLLNFQK